MRVYNAVEAAKILGISHPQILILLRNGELKGYRTSSKKRAEWRITEAEIMRFMSQDGRKQSGE